MSIDDTFPVRAEELLAHRGYVRALARRLVRDESAAEDLEQDTWMTALASPPRSRTSLRGWLASVMRSRHRDAFRGASRREARERATAQREPPPSPADAAARAEAHRCVVDAVLRLPPAARDVVLLCYFEGRTPKEVGETQGVPASTVRNRLARALERLREDLDARHGGDRGAWRAMMVPLLAGGDGGDGAVPRPAAPHTRGARSAAWAAAAAVLLVGVAALVLSTFSDGSDGRIDGEAPDAGAIAGAGPASAAARSPRGRGTRATAEHARPSAGEDGSPVDGDPSPAADAGEPIPEIAAGTGRVRVLDARTRAPAPGARVRVFTPAADRADALRARGDLFDTEADRATDLVADAHGEAVFPTGPGAIVLCARAGDREGRLLIAFTPREPVTLLLHGADATVVRVVDASGEPAKGVVLRATCPSVFGTEVLRETSTDAEGRARIALDSIRPECARGTAVSAILPLLVPGGLELVAADGTVSGGTREIRLPPTGAVDVDLVDDDGAPHRGPARVVLRAASGDPAHSLEGDAVGGTAHFARVPAGASLVAAWVDVAQRRVTAEAAFTGPGAGAAARVRIAAGAPRAVVRGRVVDAAGRGIAGISVALQFPGVAPRGEFGDVPSVGGAADADAPTQSCDFVRTGAAGEFSLLPDRTATALEGASVRLIERFPPNDDLRDLAVLSLAPSRRTEAGFDVGTVTRNLGPVVARGVVVDEDGRPLRDVVVRVSGAIDDYEADVVTQSDAAGRFELRGSRLESTDGIFAERFGWVLDPPVALGAADTEHRLVMRRAGGLAGAVVLPEGFASGGFAVVVEDGTDPPPCASLDADGSFETATLRPGRVKVRVMVSDRPSEEIVIDDVEVVAGRVTRDPRLAAIDPYAGVPTTTVQVCDADGRPVRGAAVWTRRTKGDGPWTRVVASSEGVARVLADAESESVVVAPGRHSEWLQAGTSPQRVVLAAAIADTVVVRLVPPPAASEAPFRIVVTAEWLAHAGAGVPDEADPFHPFNRGRDPVAIGEEGEATLTFAERGVWEISVAVERRLPGEIRTCGVGGVAPLRVVIAAAGERRTVDLRLDAAAVRAAARRL